MPPDSVVRRLVRVGATVLAAVAVLAVAVLLIGRENRLFHRKADYFSRFESVSGLVHGGPVQLDGVNVGSVERVDLPSDTGERQITVWFSVERRYAQRLRADSRARIRTLGLLGDKYVAIDSGDPAQPQVPIGGQVLAGSMTNVDELVASGEDVVQNIVLISHSLTEVLGRMERGEGVLGGLTVEGTEETRLRDSLLETAEAVQRAAGRLERGEGTIGRLLTDDDLADRFSQIADRADRLLAALETGPGLAPALLHDPQEKERFDRVLGRLEEASSSLTAIAARVENKQGLAGRLLADEEYGDRVAADLAALLERLNLLAERLTSGDGTAAQFINDPELYRAVQDIVVGIDDSRLLKRLLRNRQQVGREKRREQERAQEKAREPAAAQPPKGDPGRRR